MLVDKIEGKTITFPQLRGSLAGMKFPALAEVKYDGEFNYIHKRNGDIYTINKYGTIRRNFPMLDNLNTLLTGSRIKSATMLCEIYWNDGKLGELYDLLSHKKDDCIGFKIFDLIELDDFPVKGEPLITRKELLHNIGCRDWLAKCWVVESEQEASERFKEVTDDGYEGIVVKDLEGRFLNGPCSWVKMKYKDQSDYKVVEVDSNKERIEIEAPVVSVVSGNPVIMRVGVKAPNRYKKHIKVGDMVTVEHQGVLASGSLRHPVLIPKKEW